MLGNEYLGQLLCAARCFLVWRFHLGFLPLREGYFQIVVIENLKFYCKVSVSIMSEAFSVKQFQQRFSKNSLIGA